MNRILSPEEYEYVLGEDIKSLRLQKNIPRKVLCARAGISENALRHLEGGQGATVKTLIATLKALGRETWLATIAPQTSINPLHLTKQKAPRQRARRVKHAKEET